MDLNTFVSIIRRRMWVIVMTTAMTVAVATVGTLLEPPVYVATTTLRIATAAVRSGESVRFDDVTYTERLANTYSQLATSDSVKDRLTRELGLEKAPTLKVELPANTEFMRLSAEHGEPAVAARAADLTAELLIRQVRDQNTEAARTAQAALSDQIGQMEDDLTADRRRYDRLRAEAPGSPETRTARGALLLKEETLALLVRKFQETRIADALRSNSLAVIEPATAPHSPSKPRKQLIIGLGLVLGLLGGLALAFLAERFDPRLQTSEEIDELIELPVLATLPTRRHRRRADRGRRLFPSDSPQQESLRRFRAHFATRPIKTVLVTSAGPGEGKSTVVANVAAVLARSGQKVVAVDCDLRRPALHEAFGVRNRAGLCNVLRGEALEAAVQQVDSGLYVLTSGPLAASAPELLGSGRMATTLEELANAFDTVILDSPAFLTVSDAAILASAVEGVVLVVSRGQSRREAVSRMLADLARIEARVVGVVVNRSDLPPDYYHYLRRPLRVVPEDEDDSVEAFEIRR